MQYAIKRITLNSTHAFAIYLFIYLFIYEKERIYNHVNSMTILL
jgi:hypothetical protein